MNTTIEPSVYNSILEEIHSGNYSLACFILLKHTGENPYTYIPYRTARRIATMHKEKLDRIKSNSTVYSSFKQLLNVQ